MCDRNTFLNKVTYIIGKTGGGKTTTSYELTTMLEPYVNDIKLFTPQYNNDFYEIGVLKENIINTYDFADVKKNISDYVSKHNSDNTYIITDADVDVDVDVDANNTTTNTTSTTNTTTTTPNTTPDADTNVYIADVEVPYKLLVVLDDIMIPDKQWLNTIAYFKYVKNINITLVVTGVNTNVKIRNNVDNIIYMDTQHMCNELKLNINKGLYEDRYIYYPPTKNISRFRIIPDIRAVI